MSTVTTSTRSAGVSGSKVELVKKQEDRLVGSLYRWKGKKTMQIANPEKRDQYELYLAEEPIDAPKEGEEEGEGLIISYWRGVERKWPERAKFVYDALSIQTMSTECERCFSSSKKTIETRWALDPDSIEACEGMISLPRTINNYFQRLSSSFPQLICSWRRVVLHLY
jgi:hypothetical protein